MKHYHAGKMIAIMVVIGAIAGLGFVLLREVCAAEACQTVSGNPYVIGLIIGALVPIGFYFSRKKPSDHNGIS